MGGRFGGAEKGSRDCSLPLCPFTGADVARTGTLAATRLGFPRQGHLSSGGLRSTKLVVASRFHLPWG